jgi:hypothetical protein
MIQPPEQTSTKQQTTNNNKQQTTNNNPIQVSTTAQPHPQPQPQPQPHVVPVLTGHFLNLLHVTLAGFRHQEVNQSIAFKQVVQMHPTAAQRVGPFGGGGQTASVLKRDVGQSVLIDVRPSCFAVNVSVQA